MILLSLILLLASLSAIAATTYTNRWTDRPKLYDTYTIDSLYDGVGSGNNIFTVGRFFYASGNAFIGVIFKHDSNGNKLAENYLYFTTANVSFQDVEVNTVNNLAYVVGYMCNSVNCAGIAKNYSVTDLSSSTTYLRVNLSASYDVVFHGVCSDGAGNVYFTGELVDRTSSPAKHYMVIYSYDDQWNPRWAQRYSTSYNLTGWDCVVAQNGYLYVTATDVLHYGGANYPVIVYVIKINPASGDPISDYGIPAYNSNSTVNRYALSYVDIDATSSEIVIAFSYTDELPSPTSPSAGAAIAGFDYTPSMIWRKNITTSSNEVFEDVAAGGSGEVVAGGYTYNNYGTSLSTSHENALIVILNEVHDLEKAILAGDSQGQYGTVANAVFVDSSGNVYWTGYAGNDDAYLAYYDITGDIQVQVTPIAEPVTYSSGSVKLPEYVPGESGGIVAKDLGLLGISIARASSVKPTPLFSVEATPGGDSTGLIVATSEVVSEPSSPPVPVPEPALGVIVATVALLTYLLYKSRHAQ